MSLVGLKLTVPNILSIYKPEAIEHVFLGSVLPLFDLRLVEIAHTNSAV
jgi:hypothetical protein